MSDEQWLREALGGSVPDSPPTPDRAEASRRRAHTARRRGAAVVAGAVAVVLAGVLVPGLVSGGDSPGPASSTSSPSPDEGLVGDVTDVDCPSPAALPAPGEKLHGPGTLPDGAVVVRLCQGSGIPFQPPGDALVSGAAELAALVNEQPEQTEPEVCLTNLGPGYLLAFGYPDGSVHTARGELYGCRRLTVGATTRANPVAPFERFIELLRHQRQTETPPADPGIVPSCFGSSFENGPGRSPVGRPEEMVTAVLCARYDTATERGPQQVVVPESDLALLLEDREAHRDGTAAPPERCEQPADLQLMGATAWGDLTDTFLWCGLWSDERGRYWKPGPEAQEVLDRLVAEAGLPTPTVDAGSTAEEVVAAYVDLLNAGGRDGARALLHRLAQVELPTAYSRIDFKVEGVRPLRFISAYGEATAVTALYREVPADGSWVDYREATFVVGRDEDGQFRIVSVEVGEVVPTGR